MYEEHPQFPPITNKDAIVWKYMDIFKYLSLLEDGLFLLRVDKFADKYDGFMPPITEINGLTLSKVVLDELDRSYSKARQYTYANCWSLNDNESSLMWDCYSNKLGGVAIKTTIQKLCDSITDERKVYVTPVKYDFPNVELGNNYAPMWCKRAKFSDEKEIRLFHADLEGVNPIAMKNSLEHISIKVDLDKLIDKVLFHPAIPDRIVKTLTKVIATTYGVSRVPNKSTLYSYP